MRPHLMFADRDFELPWPGPRAAAAAPPAAWETALSDDLALTTLERTMAGEDAFLLAVARRALRDAVHNDAAVIRHRQDVLRDFLRMPQLAETLYALVTDALERKRRRHFTLGTLQRYPGSALHWAVQVLQLFIDALRELRDLGRLHAHDCRSAGLRELFATLERELDDDYLAQVGRQLDELRFEHGLLVGARLGPGNISAGHALLRPHDRRSLLDRLTQALDPRTRSNSFVLDPRDEQGFTILGELRDRAVARAAAACTQAAEHIAGFFAAARAELGFHVGCLRLHAVLTQLDVPLCFPDPEPAGSLRMQLSELRDPCLALTLGTPVVGSTLRLDDRRLVVITGANRGGKSSFLRGLGVAQLMMQSGMFVAAASCALEVCSGLYTHFRREEDRSMQHGKLDEELARLSGLVDHLRPGSLLLSNESFASTNEREGAEIGHQVLQALRERGVRVVLVTHLWELARRLQAESRGDCGFVRAEVGADGVPTFRVIEGAPQPSSHGPELYDRLFAGRVHAIEHATENQHHE
ncbi:DNA mismatch repair protein MutS [Fontimonas sp. SYSU GA230001]|uniref:MutS-related protein n=1 Tax=Fontimonas sp. SYSU GA230001 TaxID=3142450 RepID=UPI0032B4B8DD